MRAHQGRVTVQSVPGQGSCFSLWLPLAASRGNQEQGASA
ncbi:hypothetical protein [Oceanisphaera psychrotolerans]|nr:hypothetical protein [Oceanisphaera psychrotolerans]